MVTVKPDFTAVEIGFLNPDIENLTLPPGAISAVLKALETVNVSVELLKLHEIVVSKFSTAVQR